MLWFVEKTDICNFADDNTIYSCTKSVNDVIKFLQSDMKITLKWFKDNQMMDNPGKFQFMILGKNTINKLFIIDNKTIESLKSVKLLWLTIDNKDIMALPTEVYKTTRGENPIFMNKIFTPKK